MENNKNIMLFVGVLVLVGLVGVFMLRPTEEDTSEAEVANENAMEVEENDSMMEEDEEIMEEEMSNTIVDIAASNEDFSTLVTAVTEAGLVETLSGEGPFTVFAPTNEAFNKLPAGTLEAVLADQEQLTSILTYHVVSGKVMAEDVVGLSEATTVQGQTVEIRVENGQVYVNDAMVVTTDIEASNGVIHVIDTVLLPQ